MARQTSQTDDTNLPASKETDVLDRVKSILSPLKGDRWLSAAILAVIAASAPAVWNWVELQKNPTDGAKQKFDASLDIVKTVATVAGGAVLYLNFKVASQNAEIAQKKLDQDINKAKSDEKLAESRLKMERFNKAVEMLGKNDSIHLRLGGIYALESIAADSDKDTPDETYRLVLEVLTAFVRENATYPPKKQEKQEAQPQTTEQPTRAGAETAAELPPLHTDIQAVLTVLKRRKHKDKDWEQYPLDLRKTDLRKASLRSANLQEADLRDANLQQAFLFGANLQEAFLFGANLQQANLGQANLQQADFRRANLQQADLGGANLYQANLEKANLQDSDISEANLQQASLGAANLQGAHLAGVNFQKAYLTRANLRRASFWSFWLTDTELAEAKEEARANLQSATNWETAQYDPEIREWLGLSPENLPTE